MICIFQCLRLIKYYFCSTPAFVNWESLKDFGYWSDCWRISSKWLVWRLSLKGLSNFWFDCFKRQLSINIYYPVITKDYRWGCARSIVLLVYGSFRVLANSKSYYSNSTAISRVTHFQVTWLIKFSLINNIICSSFMGLFFWESISDCKSIQANPISWAFIIIRDWQFGFYCNLNIAYFYNFKYR